MKTIYIIMKKEKDNVISKDGFYMDEIHPLYACLNKDLAIRLMTNTDEWQNGDQNLEIQEMTIIETEEELPEFIHNETRRMALEKLTEQEKKAWGLFKE